MHHGAHHDALRLLGMRTTVTLADDVVAAIEQARRERSLGLSEAVNVLIREGLAQPRRGEPFDQRAYDLGSAHVGLDDVAGAIDALDGPRR
jgi:hypothetical protein